MADKCRFEGETVRHFNAGKLAVFELRAEKVNKTDVGVNIISKFFWAIYDIVFLGHLPPVIFK